MSDIHGVKVILDGIKKDLETTATNAKIDELVAKIKAKDKKTVELENKVNVLETKVDFITNANILLERKLDDSEQYQRRLNLTVYRSMITCKKAVKSH